MLRGRYCFYMRLRQVRQLAGHMTNGMQSQMSGHLVRVVCCFMLCLVKSGSLMMPEQGWWSQVRSTDRAVLDEECEAVPRDCSVRKSLRFWAAGIELKSRLQSAGRGFEQEGHIGLLPLRRGCREGSPSLYIRNKDVMARLSCRLMKRKKWEQNVNVTGKQ